MSQRASKATWLLVAIATVVAGLIWFTVSGTQANPRTPKAESRHPDASAKPAVPVISFASERENSWEKEKAVVTTREVPGDPGEPPLLPPLPLQKGELPWEKRIREVVSNAGISEADKARLLLDLLPALPVEGRETAAEEAARRVPNNDYRIAQNVVLNPATYPPALAVLWADLMQRPNDVSLPTLLMVARNSSHPYAPTARQNLELLVGQDHGTNWGAWEAAIRERLRTR